MKTKKCGLIAALTAALVITVLIVSCLNPVDPSGIDNTQKDKTPPASGYIKIQFANDAGRTIRPGGIPTLITDFSKFDVLYALASTPTNTTTVNNFDPDSGSIGPIAPGTYIVTLLAYIDDSSTDVLVASGQDTSVEVTASAGDTATITLKEITDGEGDGFFEYTVISNSSITAALMTLINLADNDKPIEDEDVITNDNDTITIPSGFYRLEIALTGASTVEAGVKYIDILHIYEGLTSTDNNITLPTLKNIQHTVTFNYNDGRGPGQTFTQNVTHGTPFADPNGGTDPIHGGGAPNPQYLWNGWWTAQNTGGTKWNFGTGYAIRNTTLYGRWIDLASIGITITATLGYTPVGGDPTFTGATTFDNITGTSVLNISVSNAADFNTGSFIWTVDGVSVTPNTNTGNGGLADGSRISLTFGTPPYAKLGAYNIVVQATETASGAPLSGKYTITVSDSTP